MPKKQMDPAQVRWLDAPEVVARSEQTDLASLSAFAEDNLDILDCEPVGVGIVGWMTMGRLRKWVRDNLAAGEGEPDEAAVAAARVGAKPDIGRPRDYLPPQVPRRERARTDR